MKIRFGFVSNSSSSSYIIMTTLSNHERVMVELDPYTKAVIEAMLKDREVGTIGEKFMGTDIVSFGVCRYNSGETTLDFLGGIDYEYDEENEDEDEPDTRDAWDRYVSKISEKEDEVFREGAGG